ncbi:MAG: hypothetical protein M3Z32_00250 [Acidobacteriota bacterium]|nr:hypothetical protein [Acidobacteriota bacterium]
MTHPDEIQLALFAGDDLDACKRWRVGRHLRRCTVCRHAVTELKAALGRVRDLAADIPDGLNWARLSDEMTGNIRVGLAAGECIAGFEKSARPKSGLAAHAGLVVAGATVVAMSALWVQLPKQETDQLIHTLKGIRFERMGKVLRGAPLRGSGVVLEASPGSIGIKENGGALTLLHPQGASISVNLQGSAGVRFVDADTDQVTTNRVYYAQ